MKRTQTGSGRELVKIRLLSMMSIQEPDHVCNSFVIIHTGSLSSLTFDAHPLLAAILAEYFSGVRESTGPDKAAQLACEGRVRLVVVLITPNDDFQNLRADLAPALQRRANSSPGRPIFGLGRGHTFVGRPRVPIAVKDVQRRTAIVESIGTDGHVQPVDCDHAQTVVAFHCSAACRKTNVRAMDFHKTRRSPARQPFEGIHDPPVTIIAFPGGAATFIEVKQRL